MVSPMPSTFETTSLLLVSRQRLFRDCLARQLSEVAGFEVAGGTEDLARGISEARKHGTHLLVIDEGCLDEGGFAQLEKLGGEPKTVVLGLPRAVADVRRYADAGIGGFVYRDTPLEDLTSTLAAVVRGERVCGSRCARDLFASLTRLGRLGRQRERMEVLRLTPRQMEVLRLIARGLGNEQIADRLGLSPHTVKNHVHNVLERLKASDRAEAIAHAYQWRWLP